MSNTIKSTPNIIANTFELEASYIESDFCFQTQVRLVSFQS